jgi:hypothetical protein
MNEEEVEPTNEDVLIIKMPSGTTIEINSDRVRLNLLVSSSCVAIAALLVRG